VFPATRTLSPAEEEALLAEVDEFLQGWEAHGRPLMAGREWLEGRFLMVAVDDRSVPPSGCSIDALVNRLEGLGRDHGLTLVDRSAVWFRAEGGVRCLTRPAFKGLAKEGAVDLSTVVFDLSITRVAEFRNGAWEKPVEASWHRRAFFAE
jgi:hypothetical protein